MLQRVWRPWTRIRQLEIELSYSYREKESLEQERLILSHLALDVLKKAKEDLSLSYPNGEPILFHHQCGECKHKGDDFRTSHYYFKDNWESTIRGIEPGHYSNAGFSHHNLICPQCGHEWSTAINDSILNPVAMKKDSAEKIRSVLQRSVTVRDNTLQIIKHAIALAEDKEKEKCGAT